MRMKKVAMGGCLAAATMVLCAGLSAQQTAPTAHELAQRVDHHYNQLHSLKSGFTESYEGLGMQRTESGTLLLLKPGTDAVGLQFAGGKAVSAGRQVRVVLFQGRPAGAAHSGETTGQFALAAQVFAGAYRLKKEMDTLTLTPGKTGRYVLSGQPKGQEQRVSRLSLTVTADGTIDGIEIEEADGAITRFTFTGEVANAPVSGDAFRFNAPAGVPVVDGAACVTSLPLLRTVGYCCGLFVAMCVRIARSRSSRSYVGGLL